MKTLSQDLTYPSRPPKTKFVDRTDLRKALRVAAKAALYWEQKWRIARTMTGKGKAWRAFQAWDRLKRRCEEHEARWAACAR